MYNLKKIKDFLVVKNVEDILNKFYIFGINL